MVKNGRLLRSLAAFLLAVLLGISWAAIIGAADARSLLASGDSRPQELLGVRDDAHIGPVVEPEVWRRLASPEGPLHIIVMLKGGEDTDLSALMQEAPDLVTARGLLAQKRKQLLAEAAAPLAPVLAEATERGNLLARRDLWLVHALALTARSPLVHELVASPIVAEIRLDRYRKYTPADLRWQDLADAEETEVAELPWGITQIRAPEVWQTLEVTGTGAVVGIMDTGVDWNHPALYNAYRGYLGKDFFVHEGSWFDAVNGGVYPYDDHGHGTHVAGTAVGSTVGIAPGAKWIGAKVLSGDGYGYDSWILSALQWFLAPGGEPALAPDVVNASWSSADGSSTTFLTAIEALEEAGIFATFAAGNSGPSPQTMNSPASNPGVFAVGASDADDDVAYFSSRGPSPWGEIKPALVAPGVNVISSIPGGVYASRNGTSMASPHVAGTVALMRAASPEVSVRAMSQILTETARALTTTIPNNDSGWGRLDAFEALFTLTQPAIVSGTVREASGGPIAGAVIRAQPEGVAPSFQATSDADGRYRLALRSGIYEITASAFGYTSDTVSRLEAPPESSQRMDFELSKMATGTVRGLVLVEETGAPPSSTVVIRALNTPVTATSAASGSYALSLPGGTYVLEVRGIGYGVLTDTVSVSADEVYTKDFRLHTIPRMILVDEGAWYYESEVAYWREALDGLHYAYDEVTIKVPERDVPTIALSDYDIALWSSPSGSPGLVGAGSILSGYLATGGRLLISGQDIAYLDAGGLSFWGIYGAYLFDQMSVSFADEISGAPPVSGAGPFEGLKLTLNGDDSANNQGTPDIVTIRDHGRASPIWFYDDQKIGGVATDICVPFRSLFFGFGYEGIQGAQTRREVLERSIDWLATEPLTAGLEFTRVTDPIQVALPKQVVTHVVKLRHIGYAGVTEPIHVEVEGNAWPTSVETSILQLSPCSTALITVTVTLPAGVGVNATDRAMLSATSDRVTTPVTIPITSKAPAPVLLVDDDRWYPMESRYIEALTASKIPFDIWDTQSSQSSSLPAHSPTTATLEMYPITVWFTGYDWYAPVVSEEAARLVHYLDQGGHLLLSSQDFVYHHDGDPLAQRLGVRLADWEYKATEAQGVAEHPAGGDWGPVGLAYPFPNWSHVVEPTIDAVPMLRGQLGQPIAIATEDAQTLFYAFPLETLPSDVRAAALARGIGWLSPLGETAWSVSPRTTMIGETVTFTLGVRNGAQAPHIVQATHQIPDGFNVDRKSLPPDVTLDPQRNQLSWEGMVEPSKPVTLTWRAAWTGGGTERARPTVTLTLPSWDLGFVREAAFYGAGPDLTSSEWVVPGSNDMRTGTPISLTFVLRNQSPTALASGDLSLWLMRGLSPVTATEPITRGLRWDIWTGSLEPNGVESLTIPIRGWDWAYPLRVDALMTDGANTRWEQRLWLQMTPWRQYLPTVTRNR